MDFESYLTKRRRDPEYRGAERRLKPILDLADEVFELRMDRGWTQAELAERVGTAQANISRLENGLANPTFEFLQKLAEAFETKLTVHLRPQAREIKTRIVPVLIPDLEYQDLFTMSVDVYAQREGLGEIAEGKVAA
jgi:transcriptional regulator with XRE-family HTH domain